MIVTRRVTLRLYPNRHQEQKLFYHRRLHCLLYNAAVANRRTQYKRFGKSVSKEKRRKRAPKKKKGIKASKRWKKAQSKVSKRRRKVANQRKDWAHQTTAMIVSSNSLVVGEKLTLKNMTKKAQGRSPRSSSKTTGDANASRKGSKRKRQKAGLNRSILDTGMSIVSKMLSYKEEEVGGMYLESPTRTLKPTQRCNKCWKLTPKSLSDRIHNCHHCPEVGGRDENAAKVNLQWVLGTSVQGNNTRNLRSQASTTKPGINTGGWKQAWEVKRQKLHVQASANME